MAHRKWKEAKQLPSTAGPGNMLGCCLIYFHFLWAIHPIRPVLLSPQPKHRLELGALFLDTPCIRWTCPHHHSGVTTLTFLLTPLRKAVGRKEGGATAAGFGRKFPAKAAICTSICRYAAPRLRSKASKNGRRRDDGGRNSRKRGPSFLPPFIM